MAHEATTRDQWYPNEKTLYVAFELSNKKWRLLCSAGGKKRHSGVMVPGSKKQLHEILQRARKKFGLSEDVRILSCIEAGRDGFWPHWFLVGQRLENLVVDASSMKVSRKGRRAKTDKIDVVHLLADLMRHDRGDDDVWRVVHVPAREDELHRHEHRELQQLKQERKRYRCQIRSLLATEGIKIRGNLLKALEALPDLRNWDGEPLPTWILWRLQRKAERLTVVEDHIKEIEKHQIKSVRQANTAKLQKIAKLARLRGIGVPSAWVLVMESLGWRQFNNRKQVGASVGLVGMPYDSGESCREQGISKAGNARLRSLLIELSWLWVRYQPNSTITKWFIRRYGGQGKRSRRVGIVGVARRLMIQLWHFLEHDVNPPGAILAKA